MPASAPKAPKSSKPAACRSCSLFERGHGFVEPSGPANAPLLFMGEAPGYEEAATGMPFIGAAGSMLERILRRNHLNRQAFRVGNVLQCVPPGLELRGAQYEFSAIDHCRVHRDKLLNEGHPVVMALGATPLRTLLGLHGQDRIRVEEFHGTVHRDPEDRFSIVPSFHPSYLQRGAHNLIGTVSFDLQVALEVARGEWKPQPLDLILDPPVDWFEAWVQQVEAAVAHDPEGVRINCDIETPDKAGGKPENELGPDDASYTITRMNFAVDPDQGITVPYVGPYIPLIDRILARPCPHDWWNGSGYDWARCLAARHTMIMQQQFDMMLAAHILQSDVPLGLGFWAPFYSRYGAWKHLSQTDPIQYACIDGPQGYRVACGLIGDLIQEGQWRAFQEDCHELYHHALKPAQDLGVLIDQPELQRFHEDLEVKQRRLLHTLQGHVPDDLRPLTGETARAPEEDALHPAARTHNMRTGEALKSQPDPIKKDLYSLSAVRVEKQVVRVIKVCKTCGAQEVHAKHRCKDERGKPAFINDPNQPSRFIPAVARIELEEIPVSRWFWQEPFNPDSAPQVMAYLKFRKHTPGKSKTTKKDSADRETLIRLAKSTKDPFYQTLLDYRAVKKVDSTYAVPTLRRVEKDPEGRLHPIPTFRPSTQRLSYVSPNITNVVADKGGKENLAAGFRKAVVAAPGCRLLEVDFASAEPNEVGWFIRDPTYLRLAKLGAHAYVTSHAIRRPADLQWSDADLGAYLKEIKEHEPKPYDACKRANNGINYGLTAFGMAERFPEYYKDAADAQRIVDLIFSLFPSMPTWHFALQQQAYDTGFIGGRGEMMISPDATCYTDKQYAGPSPFNHPFQYKHWFWSVLAYKPITYKQRLWREKRRRLCAEIQGRWFAVDRGEDSKRVIAFLPQSTAAGVLKRSIRALFHPESPSFIGDAYYGRTPLRAPIHDSLLLEIPDGQWDRVCEAVFREMQRPIAEQPLPEAWQMGTHLQIGVDAKVGKNWADTEKLTVPGFSELGVGGDDTRFGIEDLDEEEMQDMEVVA